MTKAFVHGNPETSALWGVLVDALGQRGVDDMVLLSPPGFGAPLPNGWAPTRANYCDWLIGELEQLGGDVDLVGHDWGAGHVYGLLSERPDLVRTWAADCGGMIHADYVWHDMAQQWRTPEVGEEAVAALLGGSSHDRALLWQAFGLPEDVAAKVAEAQDETMGHCILGLYRSSPEAEMHALGERLQATEPPPGLVIIPSEDEYPGTPAMAALVAASLGADTVTLAGQGHWWMFEGADQAADALTQHWSRSDL